jgi:hypothetical protein
MFLSCFFDIFKIDPTTKSGQLIYNDTTNQLSSTDFNTCMLWFKMMVLQILGLVMVKYIRH